MEVLDKGVLNKVLEVPEKHLDQKPCKKIYDVIDDECFNFFGGIIQKSLY